MVDGQEELVGSNRREALSSIAVAGKRPHATVKVERIAGDGATPLRTDWTLSVDATQLAKRPALTHLFVAITEDGLSSSVTRGENEGHTLKHTGVVRWLRPLGQVRLDRDGRIEQK